MSNYSETDFSVISNFIGDCFQYFRDTIDFPVSDDVAIVYRLLCIAQYICDKHIEK